MDSHRARELVTLERTRIGQAHGVLERPGSQEASYRIEPRGGGSEDVYQDEFDAGRAEDLHRRLTAFERAEARP